MALEVIGAGFGRTGTTSLKAALEQLGFSKCHHMEEVAKSGGQVRAWLAIAQGGEPDWDAIFDGFRASCDWPSCEYWEALLAHYPEAKVILTLRDPDRWYDSVARTIYPVSFIPPRWISWMIPYVRRFHRMVFAIVWDGRFQGRFEDRAFAIERYREHNERVKAKVPADRLLVFQPEDGWEPLCEFLGVPVPERSYPHLNQGDQVERMLRRAGYAGWTALALVAGLLGYGFFG